MLAGLEDGGLRRGVLFGSVPMSQRLDLVVAPHDLGIILADVGPRPDAAVEETVQSQAVQLRAAVVGHDLVAQHDVVDDVGLADRLADKFPGAEAQTPNSSSAAAKPGDWIQPGLRYGPRYKSTKTTAVAAKITAMSTFKTLAEYKTARAESGRNQYQPAPPAMTITAPSSAGRVERDSMSLCKSPLRSVIAACR